MKILISPSSFGQIDSKPIDLLNELGFEIIQNPFGRKLTEDEVIAIGNECTGIIAGLEPLTAKVIDKLYKLKVISRVGTGMDNIDLEYADLKGVKIFNTPDGPTRSVAEFTLALTLALLRKIPQAHYKMKDKIWSKETGYLLSEKKIGIIGLGRIGRLVAELFRGLGNEVLGYDIAPDQTWADENMVTLTDLNNILKNSDILSLHIPSKKDKTHIIGVTEFAIMKKSAFLINTSRGDIVDEGALIDALIRKNLRGAAVDVFVEEPYYGPLCELENVVLTPHLGSYANEGKLQMEIDSVYNLINGLKN